LTLARNRGDRGREDAIKAEALAMVRLGRPLADIARELGLRRDTVAAWALRDVSPKKPRRQPASSANDYKPGIPRWLAEIQPTGVRVQLELTDDGMGSVRLVARITSAKGELGQESWSPTDLAWAERLLMHLSGILSASKMAHHRPTAVPMDDDEGEATP
jgi:hypothetical protein